MIHHLRGHFKPNFTFRRLERVKFHIPSLGTCKKKKVCATTLLAEGYTRVRNLAEYLVEHKSSPERRGGYQIDDKKENERIRQHIDTFRCKDSHYARSKVPHRQFLPSTLNVAKMHAVFLQLDPESLITYKRYYHVFVAENNLNLIGQSRTDIRSTCATFALSLKNEQNGDKKEVLVAEQLPELSHS